MRCLFRIRGKVRATAAATLLLLSVGTSGCAVGETVGALQEYGPSPDLGRPTYVRNAAGVGGWLFGGIGAVVSIAFLPVTYPLSLIAEKPLGMAQDEFRLMPIPIAASAGHFAFGAPVDMIDFLFRRAWIEEEPHSDYEFKPMPEPKLADVPPEPGKPEPETPKKEPSKKSDPKKSDPKKSDPKKPDPKKSDPKKSDPKK